jgi:hypothetical protein
MRVFSDEEVAVHVAQAAAARGVDEHAHQAARQALALPVVGHDDGELAGFAVRVGGVAGDADFLLGAVGVDGGDEGHLAVVVDLGQAHHCAGETRGWCS